MKKATAFMLFFGFLITGVYAVPVANYSFENNAIDTAGGYNGTVYGDTTFITGKVGQSIYIDGSGDYVSLPIWDTYLENFTISLWFNCTGNVTNAGYFLTMGQNKTSPTLLNMTRLSITFTSTKQQLNFGGSNGTASYSALHDGIYNDSSWHHIAGVYNSLNYTLYIDGVLMNSTAVSDGWIPRKFGNTSITSVGRVSRGTAYFKGAIDELTIYNYSLTGADILTMYLEQGGTTTTTTTTTTTIITAEDVSGTVDNLVFMSWSLFAICLIVLPGGFIIARSFFDGENQVDVSTGLVMLFTLASFLAFGIIVLNSVLSAIP